MSRSFTYGLLAGSALLCVFSVTAIADTSLPAIDVEAPLWSVPSPYSSYLLPQNTGESSYFSGGDSAEILMSVPGVSGGRMGGHGIEPFINGQKQTQLNIINDGAFVHGGCPNRMDPPTSYAPPESYDSIEVIKGYQSVMNGAGGTGGTVLFERDPLTFERYLDEGKTIGYKAKVGGGFQSNGSARDESVDVGVGNDEVQLRGLWSHFHMNDYRDGNGNKVRSAATSESFALLPVWTPTPDTIVSAGVEISRMDDVLYAGASMDAPYSNDLTQRLSVEQRLYGDILKAVAFNAYLSDVDHIMDNYSLRSNTGMKMKAVSASTTSGGTLSGDVEVSGVPLTIGVDLQNNNRWAKRYSGPAIANEATTPQSNLWPDAQIKQTGLFVETTPELSNTLRLKVGARYDRVNASADSADVTFGAVSANTMYQNAYGVTADDHVENNFGGLVRVEYDVRSDVSLFAGLSRSVRTADATERYIAANSAASTMKWIGNPNIAPEKHHQIDAGVSYKTSRWEHRGSAFYDWVNDYIFRDRARGQSGIVATSGETIYRNVNAVLTGFDYEMAYQVSQSWRLGANMAYVYGQNRTDHDALSQIAPLEGRVSLDYAPEDIWSVGAAWNFAMRQNRIDSDTAQLDVRKTPGYGTVDLYGAVKMPSFDVQIGVSNLFDKNYARHLNRSDVFDPTSVQVNEPGRSFGIRLNARF